jgi:tRNA pseudouridine55 synthase
MENKIDGLLLVSKPKGITSFDVIKIIRTNTKVSKIGHSGILDKNAAGLLVLGIGSGTKLLTSIQNFDKEYIFLLTFGLRTDTFDSLAHKWYFGNVQRFSITLENLEQKIKEKFSGEIIQNPPVFSSLKYKGIRSSDYAMSGISIPEKPRKINIYKIEVIDFINNTYYPEAVCKIKCSKGTYIRSICNDLGTEFKVGAMMTELCRTSIGEYKLGNAVTLDDIDSFAKLESYIIKI